MKKITEELAKVSLPEEKLEYLKDTTKYLTVQSQGTGQEFWRDFMLTSKDYAKGTGMDYYQLVTELKVRLFRLTDDSYQLQKEQLELEELEVLRDELESQHPISDILKRRLEINKKRNGLDISRKLISIESKNIALEQLYQEIVDFRTLADERLAKGDVRSFKEARYLDMQKKVEDRFVHHMLTGTPFSAPELGNYYQDGVIVAPEGAIKQIEALAQNASEPGFRQFLLNQAETQKIIAATYAATKSSNTLTGPDKLASIEANKENK